MFINDLIDKLYSKTKYFDNDLTNDLDGDLYSQIYNEIYNSLHKVVRDELHVDLSSMLHNKINRQSLWKI